MESNNEVSPYSDNDIDAIMRDLAITPVREESNEPSEEPSSEQPNEPQEENEGLHTGEGLIAQVGYNADMSEERNLIENYRRESMAFPIMEEEVTPEDAMETGFMGVDRGSDEGDHSSTQTIDTEENNADRNSESLLVRESTSRFSGADWFNIAQQQVITFLGIGGIGSWAAFLVSRVRPRCIYLYDDDVVELANLSGQLYGMDAIGNHKVSAISDFIMKNADYHDLFGLAERFTEESNVSDIMICGFDNMEARKLAFNCWMQYIRDYKKEDERKYCLFIDGRMAAESIQVFCMTGEDDYYQKKYADEWLFSDREADATICSYKQTSYCAAMIGSIITNLFINFCTNLGNPVISRDLPFMTTYEANTMYFKTES